MMTEENILNFAKTDLSTKNAFRLLGLSPHASLRDIKRKQKIITLSENLQFQPKDKSISSQEALREAVITVQDPIQRLLHRIFWVWAEDEKIPADEEKGIIPLDYFQTSKNYWEGKISISQSSIVALHNLAVIYQSIFLEYYQMGLKFKTKAKDSREIESYCEKSLYYWEEVATSHNFWQKVFEWAASENDPRLSLEFLQHLKSQFLPFLITIFLDSIWGLYKNGHETKALIIIEKLKQTSFIQKYQAQAFNFFYRRIEEEMRLLICDSKVQVGNQKPATLYGIIHQNVMQMELLLNFAQALAYEDPKKISSLKDDAAIHFLDQLEKMHHKQEYLFVTTKLLEEIAIFPDSMHLIKKTDELDKALLGEHSLGNYWFTETYFELGDSMVTALENARNLFLQRDFTGAVAALGAITDDQLAKDEDEIATVNQALSVALNALGMEWMDNVFKEIIKPTLLQENLRRRRSPLNIYSIYCVNCGAHFHDKYYTIQVDGKPYQICKSCFDKNQYELREMHSKVGELFFRIKAILLRAVELNSNNMVVKKNLDNLYEISNKMDINIESENYQTPERLKKKINWGGLLTVIVVIFVIVMCLISGRG